MSSADENITHRSTAGGTYLLKIFGINGATSSSPYLATVVIN